MKSDNEHAESLFNEGTRLYEQRNYDEAEVKLNMALEIMPVSEDIMYNLALVNFEKKNYELAWTFVNKIKGIDCKELIQELKETGFVRKDRDNKSSNLVCPKCGYSLIEEDWRCPECYFEFEKESEVRLPNRSLITNLIIESLKTDTKYPELKGRKYIASRLGKINSPESIEELIKLFDDDSIEVRIEAIKSLVILKAGAAVDPLIKLLERIEVDKQKDRIAKKIDNRLKKVKDGISWAYYAEDPWGHEKVEELIHERECKVLSPWLSTWARYEKLIKSSLEKLSLKSESESPK